MMPGGINSVSNQPYRQLENGLKAHSGLAKRSTFTFMFDFEYIFINGYNTSTGNVILTK